MKHETPTETKTELAQTQEDAENCTLWRDIIHIIRGLLEWL